MHFWGVQRFAEWRSDRLSPEVAYCKLQLHLTCVLASLQGRFILVLRS